MAKKTNDETIDLLYLKQEEKKPKSKVKNKSKGKSRNKNVPKKTKEQKDIINLDNEVIIGLTPKKETKNNAKSKSKKSKNINTDANKAKNNKKVVKRWLWQTT